MTILMRKESSGRRRLSADKPTISCHGAPRFDMKLMKLRSTRDRIQYIECLDFGEAKPRTKKKKKKSKNPMSLSATTFRKERDAKVARACGYAASGPDSDEEPVEWVRFQRSHRLPHLGQCPVAVLHCQIQRPDPPHHLLIPRANIRPIHANNNTTITTSERYPNSLVFSFSPGEDSCQPPFHLPSSASLRVGVVDRRRRLVPPLDPTFYPAPRQIKQPSNLRISTLPSPPPHPIE